MSGIGAKTFSILITDAIIDFGFIDKTQCFPLYWFDQSGQRKDGITDITLKKFQNHYQQTNILQRNNNHTSSSSKSKLSKNILKFQNQSSSKKSITKEDIFYYIYGLLHSEKL